MTTRNWFLVAALAASGWLTACGPIWYSIVLTPRGPVMERSITQRFGPEEYERVALLYSHDIDAGTLAKFEEELEQNLTLTGTFEDEMPVDSQNRGMYSYCDSPLGSAALYTERFGGRHDLDAMLDRQETSFNLLWDIVLLEMDALVGDASGYGELRAFLDATMRADMWDLLLELTISDLGEDSSQNLSLYEELPDDLGPKFMRVAHFLDARGYLTLQETLGNLAAAQLDDEGWRFGTALVGKAVARRMGTGNGAIPAAFEALMDYPDDALDEEFERILIDDEGIARKLAEFRESTGGAIDVDPLETLEALAMQTFQLDVSLFDLGGDARKVTLYLPVEPYMTNGAWFEGDETPAYVEWSYPLANVAPKGDLAQVVFAFWAEPTGEYQVERFGARVLEDDSLANQCEWRRLLGPSLRDEWDAFIDGLRPGPELQNTLNRFRFSIEDAPEASSDPHSPDSVIARPVVRSIIAKLPRPQN